DDDKDEDFETFTDAMSHLQSVNRVATSVKASKRAETLKKKLSTKRGGSLPPLERKGTATSQQQQQVYPTNTSISNNAYQTSTSTHSQLKTGQIPLTLTQIDTRALKRVFALNSMAACFAEWVSRFVCIVLVVVFVCYVPEASCYGQPSFRQTLVYGGIMIGISTVFDVLGSVIQERILDFDITEGARAFGKLKLGWRVIGYFMFLIFSIPGAMLFLEGGFFGENKCFTQGRIPW
ncbi:hypothetical protein HDV05_003888, partial [Chytridiales sp. JEL 0842]